MTTVKFAFLQGKTIEGRHKFIEGDGLLHNLTDISDFSLMTGCDYLGIDVNTQNNRIYGISGYLSVKKLQKSKILFPSNIIEGSVFIKNESFVPGTVSDYTQPLIGKFDHYSKCICLGNNECEATSIKISEDVFISIRDEKLIAIFIKPIF